MRRYWLMKCEPDAYTIDDLQRDRHTSWEGVRNYQARNFMRDDMQVGDRVLFYASNADPSGVTGLATIVRAASAILPGALPTAIRASSASVSGVANWAAAAT